MALDFAKIVQKRMKELDLNGYRLHQMVEQAGHKVTKQTVYNFVDKGQKVNSETLAAIFDVLDLSVVAKGK